MNDIFFKKSILILLFTTFSFLHYYFNAARTRTKRRPNPAYDPICAFFYCVYNDGPSSLKENGFRPGYHVGFMLVKDKVSKSAIGKTGLSGMLFRILFKM